MSTLRRPHPGHSDPLHHVTSFQWGRADATSPQGADDPELVERRKKQLQNAKELQTQMRQNQDRRERERIIEERRRMKEEEELNNYNPFGRGGAGAPLRNSDGDVVADQRVLSNLREATKDVLSERTTPGGPPQVNDLLERTRPGVHERPRPHS